jgi:DNA polymerase II large subunit
MLKARLFGFAIALAVVITGISPVTASAAAADTQTIQMSEKDKDHKGNRALFEEKMNNAIKKWNTLTTEQKKDVYALLEDEIKVQNRLLDKLVKLGVMTKEDAVMLKLERMDRFNKLKESGDFPLMKPKGIKRDK